VINPFKNVIKIVKRKYYVYLNGREEYDILKLFT